MHVNLHDVAKTADAHWTSSVPDHANGHWASDCPVHGHSHYEHVHDRGEYVHCVNDADAHVHAHESDPT